MPDTPRTLEERAAALCRTPAELAQLDAVAGQVHAERAAAPGLAARYDAACERIVELLDETAAQRRRIAELEEQPADGTGLQAEIADALYVEPAMDTETAVEHARMQAAHRAHAAMTKVAPALAAKDKRIAELEGELAHESALVSDARHERDTAQKEARAARKEARAARREAADLITGDRSDVLHWAARQLRKTPMPTALTGPYWYGQGWEDAIGHLEDALAGAPTDAETEIAEQAAEIAALRAQLSATTRPHRAADRLADDARPAPRSMT